MKLFVFRVGILVTAMTMHGLEANAGEPYSRTVVSEVRAVPTLSFGNASVGAVVSQSFVMVRGHIVLARGTGFRLLRLTYSSEFLKVPVVRTIAAKPGTVLSLPGAAVSGDALSSCWERASGPGDRYASGSAISISVLVEDLGPSDPVEVSLMRGVVKKRTFRPGFPVNADNPEEMGDTTFVLRPGRKGPIQIQLITNTPLERSGANVMVPASSNRFSLQGDWSESEIFVHSAPGFTESC
jgi:hypothetical protein